MTDEPVQLDTPLFSFYPSVPPPVQMRLTVVPDHPCPYLPDRTARSRAFWIGALPDELYTRFMDSAFRRSGRVVYQPICPQCRACVPLRVNVDRFVPSKSQRRCWRRNADLKVHVGQPELTDEKFDLYCRYVTARHDDQKPQAREDLESFLYESPVTTLEFEYRDPAGRLVGIGIDDVSSHSLSSVYFYFDPSESRRGLGNFGALYELDYARRRRLSHYYLGYWIGPCESMRYKTTFRPYELLDTDGVWREAT